MGFLRMNRSNTSETQVLRTHSLVGWTHIIYALYASSLLAAILGATTNYAPLLQGWPLFITAVVNYRMRDKTKSTWLGSHYRWQIRTFWFSLLWWFSSFLLVSIVGALWSENDSSIGIRILWPLLSFAILWQIYRIARGWLSLNSGKPMYRR